MCHGLQAALSSGHLPFGTIGFVGVIYPSNIRSPTPYWLLCITTEQPDPFRYIAYALHLAIPFGVMVNASRHITTHYLVHHNMLRLTTERLFTQGGSSHLFGILNCAVGMGREISVLQEGTHKVLLCELGAERLVYELGKYAPYRPTQNALLFFSLSSPV
jgi:hypothetical protein